MRPLAIVLAALLLAGLGCGAHTAAVPVVETAKPVAAAPATPKPPSPLTADRARAAAPKPPPRPEPAIPPVAVVVGNDPGARPQSGLEQADIVWEIPAEGFITRYLAIFATHGSAEVGPVRSTRIYFDQLAKAYGIPLAHAGGNVDALDLIGPLHVLNIDAIYGSGGYFWRGSGRVAPDNLYTSTSLLEEAARADRYPVRSLTLPIETAAPQAGGPAASVTLDYMTNPRYTYRPGWRWTGSRWQRTINGADSSSLDGTPITAGTVVILTAVQAPDPDPSTPGAIKFLWADGGQAWVLRGGTSVEGRWHLDAQGLPDVTDGAGRPIPVGSAGPLWFEVVPAAWQVQIAR
jgi:hypothetical protein